MYIKHSIRYTLALCAASLALAASAAEFKIAGGGGAKNGSVYSAVVADIASKCSTDDMQVTEQQTSGGVQNLQLLQGNQVKAALVPSDVLFAAKLENGAAVAQIKTLVGLYPEAVHLIVRADAKKEGGVNIGSFNVGGKDVVYNQAEDLKGRPIGAVGGSVVTAHVLSDMLHLGFNVREYGSTTDMLKGLTSHEVDGVIIVAGSPSDAVKKIVGAFKLLPIRGNADTGVLYAATKISYPNLNAGHAVDTVSEQALLVTRQWKSQTMIQSLADLRACFYKSVPDLQDQTGSHPVWQMVSGDEQADKGGKWTWYDLPSATPVPVAQAATAQVSKKTKK